MQLCHCQVVRCKRAPPPRVSKCAYMYAGRKLNYAKRLRQLIAYNCASSVVIIVSGVVHEGHHAFISFPVRKKFYVKLYVICALGSIRKIYNLFQKQYEISTLNSIVIYNVYEILIRDLHINYFLVIFTSLQSLRLTLTGVFLHKTGCDKLKMHSF